MIRTALLGSLLLAAAPAFATTTTLSFQHDVSGYAGTFDTALFSNNPTYVAAGDEEVSIDASDGGSPTHTLLRFDGLFGQGAGQIGAGDLIVSATLTLHITSAGSGIKFHDMLTDWNETSASWNSLGAGVQADGIEAVATPFMTIGANTGDPVIEQGLLMLDFTAALQRMQDGSVPGYGWALLPWMPNGTNGIDFFTSEYSAVAERPLLTVDVMAVPEPGSYAMLLAGLGLIGLAARRRC